MVSRNAQLAIAALVALAHSEGKLPASAVAASTGLSRPSMSKILSTLGHGGFIVSTPGPGGGFSLTREPSEITILEVCDFFDTQAAEPDACVIDCGCTKATPCAIHIALSKVNSLLEKTLNDITIDNLSAA